MNSQTSNGHIQQNNEGSAILTVVVSMLFVMALGAALLFAAYTGYTIKIAERADKSNFYDASSAMDDIRVGIQQQVTEAIAVAYTQSLVAYNATPSASNNPQTDFNNRFIAALSVAVNDAHKNLFILNPEKTEIIGYDFDAIKALIDSSNQPSSSVSGSGQVVKNISGSTLTSISLKSISLKYVNKGYESDITTDITISMPDFFAGSSVTSSINNYAIIANNDLKQSTGGTVTVDGSVFIADSIKEINDIAISVSGSGNKLAFTNGDVICKGPISVENAAAFSFNATKNEFWASDIKLGSSTSATFDGKVYVADDLVLDGKGSSATLSGTYFGFGNGTDTSGHINNFNPEISSSIIINGQKSNLEISGLAKLSLAGVSFINITDDPALTDANGNILNNSGKAPITMGESISVKSDQLAYLVPVKCISNYASNPCVLKKDAHGAVMAPTWDPSTVLWVKDGKSYTLSNYITDKGEIKTVYKPLGDGMQIAYVFLVFSDKKYANEYFKAYFEADPSKIEQYLSLYVTLSDKANNAQINAAGNAFYMEDNSTPDNKTDDKLTLLPASDQIYATGLQSRYSSMLSPYETYVNKQKLAELASNTTLEFKIADEVVAVVSTNDNYTYDKVPPSTVRLIIASHNVIIAQAFKGIVIAGNNIIINSDVTSALLDSDILTAHTDDGITLSSFIKNSAQLGETTIKTKDSWDLDTLVYYDNWAKN